MDLCCYYLIHLYNLVDKLKKKMLRPMQIEI